MPEGKYKGSPTERVLQWIEEVTGNKIEETDSVRDLTCLEDGVALCDLANKLCPGAIENIRRKASSRSRNPTTSRSF